MARRPGIARAIRREFWRLVAAGASVKSAAASAGVSYAMAKIWFRNCGGVIPQLPEPSGRHLSLAEREEIAIGLAERLSFGEIGQRIGRPTCTVSREVARNQSVHRGGTRYRAILAQDKAEQRARRPKTRKLAGNDRLHHQVQTMLEQRMSPEQIAGRLPLEFPDETDMRISHEAIYQCLYVFGRGQLRRELTKCLRTGRAVRKPRRQAKARTPRTRIRDMVMIADRPAEVEDRAIPGDWEGDIITGEQNKSAIGVIVDRPSRYTLLLHLPDGHGAEQLLAALVPAMLELPATLRRSITWDQGVEMAHHAKLTIATDLAVYFCDPHSPWERGTNENTNGLLRQYFPKGTNLSVYSREHLDQVAAELNARPRKILGFRTPAEVMAPLLQTGSVAITP